MDFKTVTKAGGYNLRYIESLRRVGSEYRLILDFDGFASDIAATDCLAVTDALHTVISSEYERTIRQPVYDYMRRMGR
jgi:hypothetical protein